MLSQNSSIPNILIVVCCHAIYLGGPGGVSNEANWLIEPFQAGETATFTKHAEVGVELLAQSHGEAILCFSGGATKRRKIAELKRLGELSLGRERITEEITEAESYENVVLESNLFGYGNIDDSDGSMKSRLQDQIFQERFATDSYQNILLALLQFSHWTEEYRQKAGAVSAADEVGSTAFPDGTQTGEITDYHELRFPEKLIIVSHEFKRARFMKLHLPAITSLLKSVDLDWKSQPETMQVEYIGINPPFDEVKMQEIEEGDRKRGYGVWEGDLHGTGELLSKKRIDRGWDSGKFLHQVKGWYGDAIAGKIEGIVNTKK